MRTRRQRISALAKDISEYLAGLDMRATGVASGFVTSPITRPVRYSMDRKSCVNRKNCFPESASWSKMCRRDICAVGRPGPTTFLSRDIAKRLRERKVANIEKLKPDVIAAGNIGCITQIAAGTTIPVVHPVELIDWATGGPQPAALRGTVLTAATARTAEAAL